MKKRLLSMLCALTLILALFPATAGAAGTATTDVTLYAGRSYDISNSDIDHNYYVKTSASGKNTYDSVRYNRNDGVEGYSTADVGSFLVYSEGHTIVTVGAANLTAQLPAGVTISAAAHSALVFYTLKAGKSYDVSNSDIGYNYYVNTSASGKKTYDSVRYNRNDGVESYSTADVGSFLVYSEGHTIVTVGAYDIGGYMPYTRKDIVTIRESGHPALVFYTLETDKSYDVSNSDIGYNYYVNTSASGKKTYDSVRYNRNDGVESYSTADVGSFLVYSEGHTIVTVGAYDIGGYMPYTRKDIVTIRESGHPALVFYTLETGKSYDVSSSDIDYNYYVNTSASGKKTYDSVRYNRNNGVESYSAADVGSFLVYSEGHTLVTVGGYDIEGYMPYTRKDIVTMKENGHPALFTYTLETGKSYDVSNSYAGYNYYVNTSASGKKTYDSVRYNRKDGVESSTTADVGSFLVYSEGHTRVTVGGYDIEGYMPYTRYQRALTIVDDAGNALQKPSYPTIDTPVVYRLKKDAAAPSKPTTPGAVIQYVYDTPDVGETTQLPAEKLTTVTSADSAVSAVSAAVSGMTAEQKASATGVDWATLFAEETVSRAASKEVTGAVLINAAAIAELQKIAETTSAAVDSALVKGGVATARYLASTVSLVTKETGEISIQIDPDVLTTKTDKVRVETPTYAITIQIADLADELKAGKPITITAQDVGTGFAPGGESKTTTVKLNLPNGRTSNPVTLSLPAAKGDTSYQAVTSTEGKTVPSKRNPATSKMDAKIAQNGTYTVKNNQKDFTDIAKKSAEMQKAIRYLASKGIIGGTTATTFSPDGTISRAEIAALLMRALGKLDSTAVCSFPDVKPGDWYATAAASSAKHGIINGMSNGNFAGKKVIAKDQIVAVSARVLKTEMHYKAPENLQAYLGKYSDTVGKWAQSDVALATRENLVVQRVDGTFKGSGNMTRGDAAIIIYRLFNKIW